MRVAALYEALKKPEQALAIYHRLNKDTLERSGSTDFKVGLGIARCYVACNQYAEADPILTKLGGAIPDHPEVKALKSAILRHHGKLIEAEGTARAALLSDPTCQLAVYQLALVMADTDRHDEAIALLEKNIFRADFHGDSIDLWLSVLEGLHRSRYAQDALAALTRAHPDVVEFWYGLAVLANRAGEVSVARRAFTEAIGLQPNNPRILHDYAVLERIAGDLEKSRELILRALELQPDNPAALRIMGSDIKYTYGDNNFRRLNFVAARYDGFTEPEKAGLHFALAKAYEDVDEFDTAFRHYQAGGDKRRKLFPYNETDSFNSLVALTRSVTRQRLIATQQSGHGSEVPVFILGMPRSGSSLLEQILSSHPDIFGAGELNHLIQTVENIQVGQLRLNLGEKEPIFPYEANATWAERGQRYVERLEKLTSKPYARIVDKMPGNFNFVGLIHAILPNAKIIHSRRHPVETCLSCYRILFAEGHLWSYDLRQLGRYYRRYWTLMNHWRQELPNVMYEVRYEDNVADVEGQARRLISHLGLEWNDNCLKFYNTDRPVKTASVTQVRKPIYATSTNRWRKYEAYLKPLLEELGDIVDQYEAELTPNGSGHV